MVLEIRTDGLSDYQWYQIASFHSWKRGSLMYSPSKLSGWSFCLHSSQEFSQLSYHMLHEWYFVFSCFLPPFLFCASWGSDQKKKKKRTNYTYGIEDRREWHACREDFERGHEGGVVEERTSIRKRNGQKREPLHSGSVLTALIFRVISVYDYNLY